MLKEELGLLIFLGAANVISGAMISIGGYMAVKKSKQRKAREQALKGIKLQGGGTDAEESCGEMIRNVLEAGYKSKTNFHEEGKGE